MLTQYKKILITGGLGFLGKHLTALLLSLNKEVIILDSGAIAFNKLAPSGATLLRADIRDPAQAIAAVSSANAELIFHLAGNSNGTVSVKDPRFDFEANAVGTFNILEAAVHAETKRFIYVSSAAVYGKPQHFPISEQHPTKPFFPYGTSKLTGELYCFSFFSTYSLPVVIGRPFCVYGPEENVNWALVEVSRYLRWHLNQKPIQVIGDKDGKTRDFIYVKDLVQDLILIADRAKAGEVFNLGTGEEVSMSRLAQIISSITGREPVIDEIRSITNDSYRLVADISKIKVLGCVPRTSLIEGIKQLIVELGETPSLPSGITIFEKDQVAERS